MHLIGIAIERETPDLIKNNVRLTMIGDVDAFICRYDEGSGKFFPMVLRLQGQST